MIRCSYYNDALHPDKMREAAKANARDLKRELKGALPILCFSGLSGTAHAMVLAQHLDRCGMMYVRKKGEVTECHSSRPVEYAIPGPQADEPKPVLVFVDDFMSSGSTRNRVMRAAIERLVELAVRFDHEFYLGAMSGDDDCSNHETEVFRSDFTPAMKEALP
jgi:hypothetical protein